MKIYKPKTLIDGFRLGAECAGKRYVAVPQNKVGKGYYVAIGNNVMSIVGKEPDLRLKFPDKYGRGFYWLCYYEWLGKIPVIAEKS